MKKAFLLASCLAIAGCAAPLLTAVTTVGDLITRPVATAVGDKVTLEATRGLIVAHNAYQGATAVLVPLVQAGAFTPEQLTRIKALNDRAKDLLGGADATLSAAERTAGILSIVDELNRISGR